MMINYTAFIFLVASFGFAYLMNNHKSRLNEVWLICAVICASLYVLFMFMNGDNLLDTSLGIVVLTIAVYMLNEKGEDKSCSLIQLHS